MQKAKGENSVFKKRKSNRLFGFYVADDNHLELEFTTPASQKTEIMLYEASFDMLENDMFNVTKRPQTMIPKPFVLNDAVIIKKKITIE